MRRLEPWLLGSESSDDLYPILCGTPVLHPYPDTFLAEEGWTLTRAMAQYGVDEDARRWYFSRYGALDIPNPQPIDSGVYGEGYPGFWRAPGLPTFVQELTGTLPEDRIAEWMGGESKTLGLDLGCGQGGMTQRMAASCDCVFGLESNFYLAATANQLLSMDRIAVQYPDPVKGIRTHDLCKPKADNALVICGDALEPPFPDGAFEWIHCGHLLDLVEEPEQLIANIISLLSTDGRLSICTPFDFPETGFLDGAMAMLRESFTTEHEEDGLPWLRFHHNRRHVLHEDWIWIGRRGG